MPRVLIADDEDSMRTLVARAIAMDGHETVTAEDGAEALDILTREHGAFDLLLTDIQMPVMDGIALALTAARDFPKLKILMAHGGRPIWMQTAFFLLRRHRNLHLDISGIPPKLLLKYFPRIEEIAHKTLFGTDWPSPGIPEIEQNLSQFRALPLPDSVKEQILSKTALEIWPE